MSNSNDNAGHAGHHPPHHPKHHGHPGHPPDTDPNLVTVTLNRETVKTIRRGEYTGEQLKDALGVPVDHELDLVVQGEFKPIGNADKYHVRGGEHFVSQVGQGQSS
jgi:hypothetical protein